VIPKEPKANMEWRVATFEKADKRPSFRKDLCLWMKDSPILFFNLCLWTLKFFKYDPETGAKSPEKWRERPFCTWPCQDREILRAVRCIETGDNIWGLKTREMGWTWLCLGVLKHRGIFYEHQHMLVASRKEEEVWSEDDPDTLFYKLMYDLGPPNMPEWVCPTPKVNKLKLKFTHTSSTIVGESTNVDIGRSGRMDIAMVDEAAAIEKLGAINNSLEDAAGTRWYISTSKTGSEFNGLAASPDFEKANMGWFEHPEKSHEMMEVKVDKEHPHGLTSTWHQRQVERRKPRDLAENVNMSLEGSGDLIFAPNVVQGHRDRNVRRPDYIGDVVFAESLYDGQLQDATTDPDTLFSGDQNLRRREHRHIRFEPNRYGRWKLWTELIPDGREAQLRPPQDTLYGVSCDPGDGAQAANTAISVFDLVRRIQVAAFCSSDYGARDASRIAVAAALWFGGMRLPLIIWETNGAGGSMTAALSKALRYPHLFKRSVKGRRSNKKTKQLGWGSTLIEKRILLDEYADTMMSDSMITVDSDALLEASSFVVFERGGIGQASTLDDTTQAREAHGDRTIANALGWMLCREAPSEMISKAKERTHQPTWYTFAGRDKLHDRELAEERANKTGWRSM